jgi:hypothetical protein
MRMGPTPEPSRRLVIQVNDGQTVSALLLVPDQPIACLVLAHGAGAGMAHPFMTTIAGGLHRRGVATLRYQFPYMENGSRRPDRPALAQQTVRAAVAEADRCLSRYPLFAGGKSFGGRMTSLAQAASALPRVRGLVFFGFPLHPAGKPGRDRAEHLFQVRIPLLFLQGTRDALAEQNLVGELAGELGERTSLIMLPGADHSFHVPARSGWTDEGIRDAMLDAAVQWIAATCKAGSRQNAN